jgi:Flp pilus assembly pilin Flp
MHAGEVRRRLSAGLRREDGQALTEYAMVIALLAVIAVAVSAATGIGPIIIAHIASALDAVRP